MAHLREARVRLEVMSAVEANAQDDTRIHVAQLLQEQVGAVRQRRITVETLPLDEELTAYRIAATVKLTRIPTGVLAKGRVTATVRTQCIRCLEDFDQPLVVEFADEYRPTIDVLTGSELDARDVAAEDEYFPISDIHIVDLREGLRQAVALELPMAPLCREDCPGLPEAAAFSGGTDVRLAVLGRLLVDESE